MPGVARGRGDQDAARPAAAFERTASRRASTVANALPSRTTTPGTPPSRTIRLEPRPSAITGVAGVEVARGTPCRSSRSAGSNSQSAAPPDLNQTSGASGALRGQLAAHAGSDRPSSVVVAEPGASPCARQLADLPAHAACSARDRVGEARRPLGDVARAEADDHVAGLRASSASSLGQLVRAGDRRGARDGRAP